MVLRLMVGMLSLVLTITALPELDKLSDLSRKEHWIFLCYSSLNQILYVQEGHVNLVYPKGDDIAGLYHDYDTHPSLSPDGRYVAFMKQPPASRSRKYEPITIFDLQSGGQWDLTHGLSEVTGLAWSPDGKEIAFVANDKDQKKQSLYTINVISRQGIELVPGGGVSSHTPPSWSPDGKEIVFQTHVWNQSRSSAIVIVSRETKNLRKLDEGTDPSWSSDGSLIAYHAYNQNNKDCYTIKPDGTGKRLLFSAKGFLWDDQDLVSPVVWSPDMRYVVYHKTAGLKGSGRRIYLLDLENKRKNRFIPE